MGYCMEDRLSIGLICHPTYGGSGVVASELALSLAEEQHCVHLFSHEVPPRLARSSGPVEMHVAQGVPYPLFHSTPHDLAIATRILELHRDHGLDLLHAHYALPHAVTALMARQAAALDGSKPPPKVITTLHGTDITLVGNDPSYATLTHFALRSSDAVTAVSPDLARRTVENFPCGLDLEEIEVIPNFVDLELFHPDAGTRPEEEPPTVVHVSNFRPVKRVPWLVRAFAEGSEGIPARLVLVGDGPDRVEAQRLANELGVAERVRFLGTRDALPELLAPADIYALTSSQESFGLSALEAMSCGTPVVACDVGGVSGVVEHGVSGLLVPGDDRGAFAAGLRELLTDPARAAAFGSAARQRAEVHFARREIVARYEGLYRRVCGIPRAAG